MARVRLIVPLRFNLTGYDREPIALPVGEQDVPDAVAAFVSANPAVGKLLMDDRGSSDANLADRRKPVGKRKAQSGR
jgi:hypothetical protein